MPTRRRPLASFVLPAAILSGLLAGCVSVTVHETNEGRDRTGLVALRGNPMTLEGRGVRVGEPAPDFIAVGNDMSTRRLSEWKGRTVILASVPSLDTPVCATETRTFNERLAGVGDDVVMLVVSMDLPMAQKRWCGAEGIERVITLSDYRDRDFARAYGLRMRENGLLARAVLVIDRDGVVRHQQIVPEVASEPDYDAVLAAVENAR